MTAAEREASVYFVAIDDDDDEEHVRNSNIIDSMSKNRTLIVAISLGEGLAIAVFVLLHRAREREREGRHLIIRITDVNFEHRFVIVGINIRRHDF